MRPIALKGHDRPITAVKFNADGDVVLTASKGTLICLWRTDNGERIGTYNGHTGAVWSVDIDRKSKYMLSGSGDFSARLWDARTGTQLCQWSHKTAVRCVEFSEDDQLFLMVTDAVMKEIAKIFLYEMPADPRELSDKKPALVLEIVSRGEGKITQATWGPLNKTILTANSDGSVFVYDASDGHVVKSFKPHAKEITCIAWDPMKTMFLTSSKDGHAKLFDADTYELLKTFTTGRPINSCSISPFPGRHEVIVAGGQSAESVTTTRVDNVQFATRFFNAIFEEEMGSVAGHFGPVNSLAYFPDGKGFATGGEDGYVRLQHFDPSYFTSFNNSDG